MDKTKTLQWSADFSGQSSGFRICASTVPTLWAVESGHQYCHVSSDGACVTDGSGNHGSNEACVVRATQALYATATEFNTESGYDHVTIAGTQYSGSTGPFNAVMSSTDALVWTSDFSGINAGWTICASSTPTYWTVESGAAYCQVSSDGRCVTDGIGSHGPDEACTVRATMELWATASFFSVENYWDHVTIGGTQYSGTNGPFSVAMSAQDPLQWSSDFSGHSGGFTVCASPHPVYWVVESG